MGRCLKDLLIGIFITIFLLLAAEFTVGVTQGVRTALLIDHPTFHHIWRPSSSFQSYCPGDTNSGALRRVNEKSFLDWPVPRKEKAEDEYRIVFIGDSFVQGSGDAESSMPAVVVRALAQRFSDKTITAINAGTLSYSPLLSYLRLRYELLAYSPDLVVLAVDMTDDFDDWKYRLSVMRSETGEIEGVAPRSLLLSPFIESEDGIQRAVLFQNFFLWLNRKSELSLWLSEIFSGRRGMPSPELKLQENFRELHAQGLYTRFAWCRDEWDTFTEENVNFSEKMISETVQLVKDSGAQILVTAVPHLPQLLGEWSALPHYRVQASTEKESGIYFDSLQSFKSIAPEKPENLFCLGDMHLNSSGNALWGKGIAHAIGQQIIKP